MITIKWTAEPQLGERRLEPLVGLAPSVCTRPQHEFTKLALWLLKYSGKRCWSNPGTASPWIGDAPFTWASPVFFLPAFQFGGTILPLAEIGRASCRE